MPVRRTQRDATTSIALTMAPGAHEALASAIEGLSVHDHLCLIYESQEEQFAAVVPFIRHGLAAGQRCVYVADDNTVDAVGAALRSGGVDVDAESARGALRILTKPESYLRDGRFDPDGMIALLGEATAAAKADGFSALRATGETTWGLGGEPGTERLFEYEAKLNHFLPDHDALAICQYNRSRFAPDVILNAIRTHPVVVSGDLACNNFHYVPPDDFLQPDRPGRDVDWLLSSIVDAERSRQALEQASRDWSATFDATNDMVCLLARDGTVLRCNESMVSLLGLGMGEVLGKKCYELMHGSRTFFEQCPYQEMLRTGMRESFELPLGDKWYQVTADPLFGEAEEIVGAAHVVRDITETKKAREALAEKSRWLMAINALALELASLTPDADLGAFLAGRLRELTGAVAVAFSEYDPEDSVLATRTIELPPGAVKTLTAPLLRRLQGARSPVSAEAYREILSNTNATRATLTEASFGAIPPAVDSAVRKLLDVDRVVGLAYVVEGELYGTSLIALKTGAPDPPRELLEPFANIAAVSLRRRQTEEELQRASAYNRRLLEASLDPLVAIGRGGLITDVNEATVAATGCARDELVGTDFADYFAEPERARASYEQAFRDGSARDHPLEIRHRDGHLTAVLFNASTYRDADGQVVGVFAATRDVGELKRAEAEIRALNASLERRVQERTRELAATNRELQEFVYSVSHDLRSPLRAIDGFSFTVLEDYGDVIDEQGRSDLQRVRAAAQRMGELIDALLSLSRLGHREVDLRPVDLSAIARRAIDELREADPERQVEVVIEDGLVAEADTWLVDVVLENLLGNAWKFTAKRPSARIEFGSIQRDGQPVLFVRDDGAGFDPVYVDKLFAPFQRLHTAEQFPGTGIGLATVARVLGRLGGTWWAEGEVDRGATFFFTLSDGGGEELPRAVE